jgi:allantoicase
MSMQDSTDDAGRRGIAEDDTPPFVRLADLASVRVGARAILANDEFFAPRRNLLEAGPAVFVAGRFTSRGKWMDGWETRRRRTPGHDWCVIRLGMRGRIRGVDVDTSYFVGNHPSHCSIEAVDSRTSVSRAIAGREGAPWVTIVPRMPLLGGRHNYVAVAGDGSPIAPACTHLRLSIYPDGGVARFRAHGEVLVDWSRVARSRRPVDLASISKGGLVLDASDMHFGAKDNMIMPGRAKNMGDGWETRRRRGPGHDWAIVRLGAPGLVTCVEIDTNHFKGNYPESASLEGCLAGPETSFAAACADWSEILPRTKLRASHRHLFSRELRRSGPVSHVRLNIFPDGGVSRLRIYGTVAAT